MSDTFSDDNILEGHRILFRRPTCAGRFEEVVIRVADGRAGERRVSLGGHRKDTGILIVHHGDRITVTWKCESGYTNAKSWPSDDVLSIDGILDLAEVPDDEDSL